MDFQKEFFLLGAQLEILQDLLEQKQESTKEIIKREIAQFSQAKRQYHARESNENIQILQKINKKYSVDQHKNPWATKEAQHLEVLKEIVKSSAVIRKDLVQLFHEAQEHNLKATQAYLLGIIQQTDRVVFTLFMLLAQEAQENKSKDIKKFWRENAICINNLLQGYAIEAEQHLGANEALKQAVKATEQVMKTTRSISLY